MTTVKCPIYAYSRNPKGTGEQPQSALRAPYPLFLSIHDRRGPYRTRNLQIALNFAWTDESHHVQPLYVRSSRQHDQ